MAKAGYGREARPVERVDSALCALDARDSRHWARRAAVHAALRSFITSPGRPSALRPAHSNVTLWYNFLVFATSVSDASSLAKDHILEHPSLPNSAQRTQQRRVREHCTKLRRGCARRREAEAGQSPCRRDERPVRGPHHDALRAVSRIPSAKNS